MTGRTPKHRGTIILDASALIDLCGEVSTHYRQHGLKPERYLDILPFLGRHGYRVIIPEMVAIEAASVLANGTAIQRKFDKSLPFATDAILSPLLRDAALPEGDPRKEYPGLEIMSCTGPTKVDDYCKRLTEASAVPKAQTSRHLIVQLRKATDTTHFGDQAILSLLANKQQIDTEAPVLVLARDTFLTQSMSQPHDYPSDTALKLVYAMAASQLAPHLGFTTNATAENLRQDLFRTSAKYNPKTQKDAIVLTPIDPKELVSIQRTTFYSSLLQLRDELGRVKKPADAEPGANAAKFRAKFAHLSKVRPKASKGNDESPER